MIACHGLTLRSVGREAQECVEMFGRLRQLARTLIRQRGVVMRVSEVGLELGRAGEGRAAVPQSLALIAARPS